MTPQKLPLKDFFRNPEKRHTKYRQMGGIIHSWRRLMAALIYSCKS
ncbi:hypothetical protein HDE80_003801 [Rhodanobacter sp. A1T4]|nr:hypothetical protein [Rhodanobacter sp. A1T4]